MNFRTYFYIFIIIISHNTILFSQEEDKDLGLGDLLNTEISTASKYKQSINETPASVSIVTSEEIRRYGYKTLAELLNNIKSFYIRYDRNYIFLGVRGFERPSSYGNKMLLLINGHTFNDNIYQGTYYGNDLGIDMEIIERVEIVQGPGSVLYGAGAMLAVINVITKSGKLEDKSRINAEIGEPGRIALRASAGYNLFQTHDFFISAVYGQSKGYNLYFPEYNSPETNNGMAEGLDNERHYSIFTSVKHSDFSLNGYFNSRKKSIPTAAWEMAFNEKNAFSIDERSFIELKYEKTISHDKFLFARAYYDKYYYEGLYPYHDSLDLLYYWYELGKGQWIGTEAQLNWDIAENNRLSIGMEYKNNFEAVMDLWYDGNRDNFYKDVPYSILSLYAQDNYQIFDDLSLTGGIRFDKYSIAGSSITPRIGLIYNIFDKSTVKLLYGEAFRPPNVYELYYEDIDVNLPNPNLKPEKIKTVELIWEQTISANSFATANIFYYLMNDIIEETFIEAESKSQFQNLSRIKSYGAELSLQSKIFDNLQSYIYLTYLIPKNPDEDQTITNAPQFLFVGGVSYEPVKKLFCSVNLYYETKRKTITGSYTQPFLITDLNIYYKPDFEILSNRLELNLKIKNLLDRKYYHPGGYEHLQELIKQDGRNLLFNITIII